MFIGLFFKIKSATSTMYFYVNYFTFRIFLLDQRAFFYFCIDAGHSDLLGLHRQKNYSKEDIYIFEIPVISGL